MKKMLRTSYGTQSVDYCIPDVLNTKCPEIPEKACEARTTATFKKTCKIPPAQPLVIAVFCICCCVFAVVFYSILHSVFVFPNAETCILF